MHVHIVLCCGVKTVLFTNKLSECWCHIINPYLFIKFHTSKHLGELHKHGVHIVLCCGAKKYVFRMLVSYQ